MKTLRNSLIALSFIFATGGAFASLMVQQGWYDSNGATAGGGLQAPITDPAGDTPVCSVNNSGEICTIETTAGVFNAYNSKANAELRGSQGLLRIPQ